MKSSLLKGAKIEVKPLAMQCNFLMRRTLLGYFLYTLLSSLDYRLMLNFVNFKDLDKNSSI